MALSTIPTAGLSSDQGVNFRNLIINGDMSIAQRGTSTTGVTTTDGYYACDRWRSQTDIGTWTISQSTDVPTGQGFVNSFKMDCTTAGTANTDEVSIRYYMEGQHLQHLAYGTSSAKSITISFWIKTNKTGTYTLTLKNNNSSQERLVGYNYTVDSANTWEKKTITFAGDTSYSIENNNTGEFHAYWWFGTASVLRSGTVYNTWQNAVDGNYADNNIAGLGGSTADYVNITGVQLEVGTTASDFEFLPYDVNFQRCQRYFESSCAPLQNPSNGITSVGIIDQAGAHPIYQPMVFNTSKRAVPTMTYYNGSNGSTGTWRTNAGTDVSVSSYSIKIQGFTINCADLGAEGRSANGSWEADAEL